MPTTKKFILALLLICCFSGVSLAQSYEAGPGPTFNIKNMCVALWPEPQTRTEVGIGESVNLWIDNFTDEDYAISPYDGSKTSVFDEIKEVYWSVEGDAEVFPTVGSYTTLTVWLTEGDGPIKVIAEVEDGAFFFQDGKTKKQMVLDKKAPSGLEVKGTFQWNWPFFEEDQVKDVPGNDWLGCLTKFFIRVKPASVNFEEVWVREDYDPYKYTWPNGKEREVKGLKDGKGGKLFG